MKYDFYFYLLRVTFKICLQLQRLKVNTGFHVSPLILTYVSNSLERSQKVNQNFSKMRQFICTVPKQSMEYSLIVPTYTN